MELFIVAIVKGLPLTNVERKIVTITLLWSEMPDSKAIDFTKLFGMLVIISSMPVGYRP